MTILFSGKKYRLRYNQLLDRYFLTEFESQTEDGIDGGIFRGLSRSRIKEFIEYRLSLRLNRLERLRRERIDNNDWIQHLAAEMDVPL